MEKRGVEEEEGVAEEEVTVVYDLDVSDGVNKFEMFNVGCCFSLVCVSCCCVVLARIGEGVGRAPGIGGSLDCCDWRDGVVDWIEGVVWLGWFVWLLVLFASL